MKSIWTAAVIAALLAGSAKAEELLFWSSQAKPVEEGQAMRQDVLAKFGKPVGYMGIDEGPFVTRINAEAKAGKGTIGLIGGLHGEFASFPDLLVDVDGIPGTDTISKTYIDLGKLGSPKQKYVPWMQATYVMAASKEALKYLPEGVDINAITYDELIAWGKAVHKATGSPKIGLPAGPKGLMHRFLQGYLYPSYTKSVVTEFRSEKAAAMWEAFKALWAQTNPASPGYGFMQEPLLTGEVWIAWDHVARLKDAFDRKPDQFIAFPVPAGPAGRGNMAVLAGMAIPKTSPAAEDAKALIAYMLKPESQIAALKATGFFPVVGVTLPADIAPSAKAFSGVVDAQSKAPDAVVALLPTGLGAAGGKFSKVYSDAFQRIVLSGQDVRGVLDAQAKILADIMKEANAPCWAPDAASTGPCPVK